MLGMGGTLPGSSLSMTRDTRGSEGGSMLVMGVCVCVCVFVWHVARFLSLCICIHRERGRWHVARFLSLYVYACMYVCIYVCM
jgi:hypothetical protein